MSRSFPPFVIALLAVAVYWVTIPFDFVLDDIVHIVLNKSVTSSSVDLKTILSEPLMPGNIYRPGLILSYRWTHDLFGLNPVPFHITNILLHAINSVLLYLLCLRIPVISKYAWLSSLFFAVHPIHVEAVANISGRSELLCHFWGLLAINLFLEINSQKEKRELIPHVLTGACIFFALLIKESGVTYLLLIPLIIYFRGDSVKQSALKCALPLFLGLSTYILLRYQALGGFFTPDYTTEAIDNPLVNATWPDRIYTALYILVFGFLKTLMPAKLSADYSLNELNTLSPFSNLLESLSVIFVLSAIIFTILQLRQKTFLGFVGSWIFTTTLVTSNILFLSGTIFGERHLYLPSLGVCLALAKLCQSVNKNLIKLSLVCILLFAFSAKSFKESLYWENLDSFFTAQLFKAPNSAKTSFNYGLHILQKGFTLEAVPYIRKSLSVYPNSQMGHLWLGRIAKNTGDKATALEEFQKALNISPDDPEIILEMARLLYEQNKITEANNYFALLRERYPNNLYTAIAQYFVLKRKKAEDDAAQLLTQMLQAEPNNYILNELKNGIHLRN